MLRLVGGLLRLISGLLRLCAAGVAAHPRTAGGLGAFSVLAALVAANALYGQPGRHPKPILVTRADAAAGPATVELSNNGALMPVPIVREVQEALMQAGYYTAEIDGRPGPATTAAIRAFQEEQGLAPAGGISPTLLAQIRQSATEPPNPQPRPDMEDLLASLGTEGGASAKDDRVLSGTASSPAASESGPDERSREELVRAIQSALSHAQVADLQVDGIVGERTRAAIRTFEALEGLEVTGKPRPEVLDRLIAIGAAEP